MIRGDIQVINNVLAFFKKKYGDRVSVCVEVIVWARGRRGTAVCI